MDRRTIRNNPLTKLEGSLRREFELEFRHLEAVGCLMGEGHACGHAHNVVETEGHPAGDICHSVQPLIREKTGGELGCESCEPFLGFDCSWWNWVKTTEDLDEVKRKWLGVLRRLL